MSKNIENQRFRQFSLITYHDLDTVNSVIKCYSSSIKHFAGIVHDKDCKEDGSLKEKHIHLILTFYNPRTISAVRKMFPENQNTLAQSVHDLPSVFEYLTHENENEKIRYDESAIFCDDLDYWKSVSTVGERDDKTLSILDDIIHNVPFRDMVLRYGRDYVINYQKYKFYAEEMRKDEYDNSIKKQLKDMVDNGQVCSARPKPMLFDIETGELCEYNK